MFPTVFGVFPSYLQPFIGRRVWSNSADMNRGPVVLTIDEAEFLLDQMPAPDPDDEPYVTKLRQKLKDLLTNLREGAEGVVKKD